LQAYEKGDKHVWLSEKRVYVTANNLSMTVENSGDIGEFEI